MNVHDIVGRCEQLFEDLDFNAVKQWKAAAPGRKAIGYMPVYVPREIIHAAGMLPVGILGGGDQIEVIQGDAYYQSYICRIPRSTIELGLTGRLDCLDGMLFPSICDVIRNLSGMWKVLRESGTLWINPNAGADEVTGPLCAPNIFRSSFTMWQSGYAMGEVAAKKGHKKVVTITWKYAAGDENIKGFKESFEKNGGTVVKELSLPFPNVEFQALLTEIAATKPDAVFTFFAGGGAVKFVKDYSAAGLKKTIPLYGSGFLTDGTLDAQGADADGLFTTLHYADNLNNKRDQNFRLAYAKTYKLQPDVYAVQGYDAGQMLGIGLNATKGDAKNIQGFAQAVRAAKIDSPRGPFTISKSHNPVQDIYLRKVVGKENVLDSVASKALADPGLGCKM